MASHLLGNSGYILVAFPQHFYIVTLLLYAHFRNFLQGCQILLDTIYQKGGKYTKLQLNYQMVINYIKWSYVIYYK
jgi:hypothetical protein